MTYTYTREIISGSYDIDNQFRVNSDGKPTPLSKEIEMSFPGSGFTINIYDWQVDVNFDAELSAQEKALLDDAIIAHREHQLSPIERVAANWKADYVDYKKARGELKTIVWTSGWANMTVIEKEIASKWFVVPQSMRNEVFSIGAQVFHGKEFHNHSVEARKKRADAGVSAMYNYLSTIDAFSVVDDVVNTYALMDKYVNYGREGMIEDNLDGLFDYFHSRSGSMYENSGLLHKNITPIGISLSGLADAAINIFKSGNYS